MIQEFKNAALRKSVKHEVHHLSRFLLRHGANPDACDKEGRSSLHIAVDAKNEIILPDILKKNPDINMVDNNGFTPFHYAAIRDFYRAVKILKQHGADVDMRTNNGKLAVDLVPYKILSGPEAGQNPLMMKECAPTFETPEFGHKEHDQETGPNRKKGCLPKKLSI